MSAQVCPVCQGRQTVPAGFYSHGRSSTSAMPETCRSCDGKGFVVTGTTYGVSIGGGSGTKPVPYIDPNSPIKVTG